MTTGVKQQLKERQRCRTTEALMEHQTVSSEFPARRVLPEQELASKPAIRDSLTVVETGRVNTCPMGGHDPQPPG